MRALYLRKGADRRLRAGHLWIYSNEVDTQRSPLGQFDPGDTVCVHDAGGTVLGSAYVEPQSLICARLYAPGIEQAFDASLMTDRLQRSLAVRESLFDTPYYRLVYGDSDGLPGIVADRFGEYVVVQLNNASVERYREPLMEALCAVAKPAGIALRLDSRQRREQGLDATGEVAYGQLPEEVPLVENGVQFSAPVFTGQKTGWFYDHRQSRAQLQQWVAGKRVLDVYSYVGGWGVQAATAGASTVLCVDSSASALECVNTNARLNGVETTVQTQRGQATEVMTDLLEQRARFDVVVIDPPAFVTKRKALKKGMAAYRRINELALKLLAPNGLLVSASCSMHLSPDDLLTCMQQAAVRAGTSLRVVAQGGQGPDHPVHPAIPETQYLKAFFAVRD